MLIVALLVAVPGPSIAKGPRPRVLRFSVGPFPIEPHRDREVCRVVPVSNVGGMQIETWEARSRVARHGTVGSHHFVAYSYDGADPTAFPPPNKLVDDPGCSGIGPLDFFTRRTFLAGDGGAHQEGNWTVTAASMPGGLSQRLPTPPSAPSSGVIILNSHYFNESDSRANGVVKLKLRLVPVDPSKRPVRQVIDIRASRDIKVAPGGPPGTVERDWAADGAPNLATEGGVNPAGDVCILALSPHMHKRGMLFAIEYREDGKPTVTFPETRDYLHPTNIIFPIMDPAAPGMLHAYSAENGFPRIHYSCTQANGTDGKEEKFGCEETAGVVPGRSAAEVYPGNDQMLGNDDHARPCGLDGVNCQGFGTGRCVPANLVFGPLSDDDMCVLTAITFPPKPGLPPEQACNPNL